jgi:translation initiation factor 5B
MEKPGIKILKNEVIYKLIEDVVKIQKEKEDEIKREKMIGLATICKLKILPQYVFRNSNPAVFGVEVEAGRLKSGTMLIDDNGKEIAKVKDIQENKSKVEKAEEKMQVAISLPGVIFDRQLAEVNHLYSDLNEYQYKEFKKNKDLLTQTEIQILQKIAEIKRKEKVTWGV